MSGAAGDFFFWTDWLGEPGLNISSLAAQGIWMKMLCACGLAKPKGYFLIAGRPPTDDEFASYIGKPVEECVALRDELERNKVFSRDRRGVIYNRKMVDAEKKTRASAKGGRKGGPVSAARKTGIHGLSTAPPGGDQESNGGDKSEIEPSRNRDKSENVPDLEPSVSASGNSEIKSTRGNASECSREFTRARARAPQPTQEEKRNILSSSRTLAAGKNLNGRANGKNGKTYPEGSTTIKNRSERIARFQATLAKSVKGGWITVIAAFDPKDHNHKIALAACQAEATRLGKGWPLGP